MVRMLVATALAFLAIHCVSAVRRLDGTFGGKLDGRKGNLSAAASLRRERIVSGRRRTSDVVIQALGSLQDPGSVMDVTMAALKRSWKLDAEILRKDFNSSFKDLLGVIPSVVSVWHPALGILPAFFLAIFSVTQQTEPSVKLLDEMELLINTALHEKQKKQIDNFLHGIIESIKDCCHSENKELARQSLHTYNINLQIPRTEIFNTCDQDNETDACIEWRTSAGGASTLLYELVYTETLMLVVGEERALEKTLGFNTKQLDQTMKDIVGEDGGKLLREHYDTFKKYRLSNERFTEPSWSKKTSGFGLNAGKIGHLKYQAGWDNYLGKAVEGPSLSCLPTSLKEEVCYMDGNCTKIIKKFNSGQDTWRSECLREYKAKIESSLKGTFNSRIEQIQEFLTPPLSVCTGCSGGRRRSKGKDSSGRSRSAHMYRRRRN